MAWRGESRRHDLARQGIKTATRGKPIISAPLHSQSTKLPLQLAITVPSTTDKDEKVSSAEMDKRVKETAKELSNRFGGDTAIKGVGDYTTEGKLIRENVIIIESSMTRKDYEKNKPAIESFIKKKHKEWKQDTIGYKFEGDFYIYPKFD